MLEVSEGNITSLNLGRIIRQNENDIEELKTINDTIKNLQTCKNYYAEIYANVGGSFQNYLKNPPDVLFKKMEDDLRLNLYSFIDLKNEPNTKEILHTFDRFFFAFGRFPANNELTIVPKGDVPSFVRWNDVILPSELYKKFSLDNARALVCGHFLATLNVHLGGDKITSKEAMSEFFHNLSMQALSKSDDVILIKFDDINKLKKNLNDLLTAEALAFETERV